ncbi:hypothetical protein WICPIJ_002871 [Wickerhamomyces pijperi]|uniref:Intimal thickness related receptor IRP domain-containing protein n=1 Tax=Wickerhamomyces pijperi TaxID=599730 RepID=A0A9P8Q870_WICPI|nr:hypothetical protein WICPIJ_002871 [Wickerhamomyces pijperi]
MKLLTILAYYLLHVSAVNVCRFLDPSSKVQLETTKIEPSQDQSSQNLEKSLAFIYKYTDLVKLFNSEYKLDAQIKELESFDAQRFEIECTPVEGVTDRGYACQVTDLVTKRVKILYTGFIMDLIQLNFKTFDVPKRESAGLYCFSQSKDKAVTVHVEKPDNGIVRFLLHDSIILNIIFSAVMVQVFFTTSQLITFTVLVGGFALKSMVHSLISVNLCSQTMSKHVLFTGNLVVLYIVGKFNIPEQSNEVLQKTKININVTKVSWYALAIFQTLMVTFVSELIDNYEFEYQELGIIPREFIVSHWPSMALLAVCYAFTLQFLVRSLNGVKQILTVHPNIINLFFVLLFPALHLIIRCIFCFAQNQRPISVLDTLAVDLSTNWLIKGSESIALNLTIALVVIWNKTQESYLTVEKSDMESKAGM